MPKVFVQLTLSTVTSEGENQVLQAPIEVAEKVNSGAVSAQIAALMGDEKKTFSFPVKGGNVTVRGSAIEWFQVFDLPEEQSTENQDIRLGVAPVEDAVGVPTPIPMVGKKRKKR